MAVTDEIESCAWEYCSRAFIRAEGMPPGWVSLAAAAAGALGHYRNDPGSRPPANPMVRDCLLCPTHAAELERLLKWRVPP